jgi:hypothetical protein
MLGFSVLVLSLGAADCSLLSFLPLDFLSYAFCSVFGLFFFSRAMTGVGSSIVRANNRVRCLIFMYACFFVLCFV